MDSTLMQDITEKLKQLQTALQASLDSFLNEWRDRKRTFISIQRDLAVFQKNRLDEAEYLILGRLGWYQDLDTGKARFSELQNRIEEIFGPEKMQVNSFSLTEVLQTLQKFKLLMGMMQQAIHSLENQKD